MGTRQPGLRKRVEHEATGISHQHRMLAQLIRELASALDEGVQARSQQVFARLRSALRAHFLLEEDVVFPAFRGLHPEHEAAIESLTDGHRKLWTELERLEFSLDGADLGEAGRLFAALREALAAHEAVEEALLSEARSDPTDRTSDGAG
jgi:iron-sulfur cluster repair protein YtfE (RIC family)